MKFLVIVAAAFAALFGLGWRVVFRHSSQQSRHEEEAMRREARR